MLNVVPTPDHEASGITLRPRLSGIAGEVTARNLPELIGPSCVAALDAFAARSSSIWILWAHIDDQFGIAWLSDASLSHAASQIRADGDRGIIADTAASGMPADEDAQELDLSSFSNLEAVAHVQAAHLHARAVAAHEANVAVLTAITVSGDDVADFLPDALGDGAALISRLIEDSILRLALGIDVH